MRVKGRGTRRRLIEFGLYLLIALAVLVLAAVLGFHAVRTGGTGELPLKWIGLAAETAVLFGYVVRAMRQYWRNRRFWAGFLGFLVAHSAAYVVVLLRVEQFPLLLFVFVGYAEWLALAYMLELLLRNHVGPERDRWHRIM